MWLGIEEVTFKSLIGNPIATALAHLDQERKKYPVNKGDRVT